MTNTTSRLRLKHPKLFALECEQDRTRSPILHPLLRDEYVNRFRAQERARNTKPTEDDKLSQLLPAEGRDQSLGFGFCLQSQKTGRQKFS